MKKIIPLLSILLFATFTNAQNNSYEKLWSTVENFEVQGLPKSALNALTPIETKAKKENNSAQLIKILLFKSKFALLLKEDAQLSIINAFKAEIKKQKAPTKNVLENILGHLYWQYFQHNRYKFYNRTQTKEKVDTTDFRTWDLQTLFNETHNHFSNSLQNGLLLQQTTLDAYSSILKHEKDSKKYRPTLFDFLSYNALEFYKTREYNITKPAYKFEIDNSLFLADAETFSKLNINSKDENSLELHALKIYQELIKFHLKNKTPYALTDANISRLHFVKNQATFNDKETSLLKTLQKERDTNKQHETSALYAYEIASLYHSQGQNFTPNKNNENRWKLKDALTLCEAVISEFPKSKGAEKCEYLKAQILKPQLNIKTEQFLPIQTHSKVLVTHKNSSALEFKAYKLSETAFKKFSELYKNEDKQEFIKTLDVVSKWESSLKNQLDYQYHSTEILVPKLDNGRYLIVANTTDKDAIFTGFASIQITNIVVVEQENNAVKYYQFIDRHTGKPIEKAKIELEFFYRNNKTELVKKITDNNGLITIKKTNKGYRHFKIKAETTNETAYFGTYSINNYYKRNKQNIRYNAFLFTDRSIYRPSQTVYFKAIAMQTENNKSTVLANETVSVKLINSNYETLKTQDMVTNEFGSVAGEFILPNTGLNGNYRIQINGTNNLNTQASFSVEEYKRPKFEAKFNPITETFKVNDSINIKGHALAYAGSAISDAKVVYRVKRNVQFPRWYYWYRPNFYSEEQEITHGETTTDDSGDFLIQFKAIPDESVDKKELPVFKYEITADITDINGETQSTTTLVNVGYHALIATFEISETLDKTDKNHEIILDTKNLNGEFTPAKGTVKIYKLEAPNRILRPRPWEAPDYQNFTEDKFTNLFPHEAYANESNSEHWKKGSLVFDKSFNTDNSKSLSLKGIKNWKSGAYIIELEAKDKFGQLVKDKSKTTVFSNADKTIADQQLFSITSDKTDYKTNDTAVLTLASAIENVFVTVYVEKAHSIVNTYIIPLNNNKKTIKIPVTEKDLGGFSASYSFSAFNSFKTGTLNINVPFPKTDLEIETKTFRDRLQPGQEETWAFKIKGPKGDKVSAELLASMYDASLDQFKPHKWYFNPIHRPNYYSQIHSNARYSFSTQNFRIQSQNSKIKHPRYQNYDQLNWFGFNMYNKWKYNNYLSQLKRQRSNYDGIVNGTISDENGQPLPGVNVIIKGTSFGTQTDLDGNYSIRIKNEDVLAFSFIGYTSKEIKVSSKDYSFALTVDTESLDEVVVSGYGAQMKSRSITNGVVSDDSLLEVADMEESLEVSATLSGKAAGVTIEDSKELEKEATDFSEVTIRKNLQETAFFFPQLQTDKDGHVTFSFTAPEALTQWKLQLLAHTKTLEHATKTLQTVTQKELMVIPNTPRFLREGDTITISNKIANLSKKDLSGQAVLQLFDAVSGEPIDALLQNSQNIKSFSVKAKGNTQTSWSLIIPNTIQAVQYKILAKTKQFSDGEQNALPVLSNRMLVTETLPMWIKSNETKTFTLDKLKTNSSSTFKNHKLTLEITSNPAWYAIQALPYLMEYPYECNEQTFSRYYSNALASHIVNSNPRIEAVFKQWKTTDALLSNLEKNSELKSILIQETPWLRDAESETEQKKRIALLFDLNKMTSELNAAKRKLETNQFPSGAWPWFKGGRESRYITQHIITGFGHLTKLNVSVKDNAKMIQKAVNYLDNQFIKEYKDLRKYNADIDLSKNHLSNMQLHYLYMRSFYPDIKKSKEVEKITSYYHKQIQNYWVSRSLYSKGLMALITTRLEDKTTANSILKSLKENSITSEELGMYWKENTNSWHWYQAPIETQALLIEAFSEVENDTKTIDNLKIWLLKNKQTNQWKTTKATTDAVYALLLQGSDWLAVTEMVDVTIGETKLNTKTLENVKIEAGTGYFKTAWNTSEIKPKMADVTLTKKGNGIAWGGLYWQYFEDLDKITSAETPLKLKKQLFLKSNTDTGEQIEAITANTKLHVGDLVRVRIELRSDRNMEFVHMKDMRASGLEPTNVLSRYKWQDGLGYYESTKDASTNFFFDYLPKGIYVFEYDLRVSNTGNMSNGITTIQSMYAPEFSSHSEGARVKID